MPAPHTEEDDTNNTSRFAFAQRGKLALMAAGLLVLGGAAGAVAMNETRPTISMAPATPVAIRSLSSSGIVTVRGRVAEIYGNKFVMADATGRALVDLGGEGDERQLVSAGEPVTVQGRFDRGFVRAAFLIGPDNKVLALGPLAGPPHGPHGRRGPDDRADGPPPPPRGDARQLPPPPPSTSGEGTAPATPAPTNAAAS